MSIKLLLAIIFIILSLGSGLYDWFISGLTQPFPTLSFVFLAISGFLFAGWLKNRLKRKKAKQSIKLPTIGKIDEEKIAIGGLVGAAVLGTLLAAVLEGKKKEATRSEIEKMEQEVEELYRKGQIDYNKYIELKQKIAELKVK